MSILSDILMVIGAAAIVTGIALASVPAALVVGGCLLFVIALAMAGDGK